MAKTITAKQREARRRNAAIARAARASKKKKGKTTNPKSDDVLGLKKAANAAKRNRKALQKMKKYGLL